MKGFDFLIHARKFGMKLGLETMQSLADALGNPEKKLRFIHIAGTNGKGSTATLCSQTLQEAGHSVGVFTSPHLVSITERIQINNLPIPESTLTSLLDEIAEVTRTWENPPTFFEILTAAALLYFERQKVEWVLWETGMGGRLDSTNIVTPVVSVITQIGLDHQEFLGESLAKIALEKAGIIKTGIPTVCGVHDPEILPVIHEVAADKRSACIDTELIPVENLGVENLRQKMKIDHHLFETSLIGPHQVQNAVTAYTVLHRILHLPIETIQRGFSKAIWLGRFQILRVDPPLVVDGAHNHSSAQALVDTWKSCFGKRLPHIVFGVMEDKDYLPMIDVLKTIALRVTLLKPNNPRSAEPQKLAELFKPIPTDIQKSLAHSWPQILSSELPLLITGSLFLVGEALQLHHPHLSDSTQNLNELLKS